MSEAARKLGELLTQARANQAPEPTPRTPAEQAKFVAHLQEQEARMREARHAFYPGQLLQWKAGLDNRTCPGPFVFVSTAVDVMDEAALSGSPSFREPLDAIVGYNEITSRDGDTTYIELYVDSRRLEPYTGVTLDSVEFAPGTASN